MADLYAPYGQVVETVPSSSSATMSANQGSAKRINYVGKLSNNRSIAAKPNLCVFKCTPRPLPFDVKLLERHPYSSQTFIPMNAKRRYLVVVAQGGDQPDLGTLAAFVATNTQGINYNMGCWHHPMIALDEETDFACLVWEDGTDADCEVVELDEHYRIVLPPDEKTTLSRL